MEPLEDLISTRYDLTLIDDALNAWHFRAMQISDQGRTHEIQRLEELRRPFVAATQTRIPVDAFRERTTGRVSEMINPRLRMRTGAAQQRRRAVWSSGTAFEADV